MRPTPALFISLLTLSVAVPLSVALWRVAPLLDGIDASASSSSIRCAADDARVDDEFQGPVAPRARSDAGTD